MIWDPFLMKKLIKNEIYGSVNSAYVHCSLQKVNICSYCSLNSNRNTPRRVKTKKKKRNKTQLGNADLESKHTLNAVKIKFDMGDLFMNEENYRGNTPWSDF